MLQYLFVVGESVGFVVEFLFVNALTQAFLASAFQLPVPWESFSEVFLEKSFNFFSVVVIQISFLVYHVLL